MTSTRGAGILVEVGGSQDHLIANATIPRECWLYMASDFRANKLGDYACPWCPDVVFAPHGVLTRCNRDHIIIVFGNALFIWTREQDATRKPDYSIEHEERIAKEDEIARSGDFRALGEYIQRTTPKRVDVARPSSLKRVKYTIIDALARFCNGG